MHTISLAVPCCAFVLPVSTASAERSFSTMKRDNTTPCSCMALRSNAISLRA
ncbi:hypothetical protein PR003_g4110 [Phytophthora rubi]|uniref:HAT C-terminal dimerisation domain-containing protein n=1 Tax=Phytophthora rubi TaxID=129364 RepID=A0A6A3NJF9_9STRA|nr:hypothetical protein PR002_g4491 [Phytophthora rubi]KAE9047073.1 hypothetical protein PR001_g4359 [Phytophthora rubi]KAE9352994.1 hypothetical protein PR003_g4110 [Phytophthora rubi]